MKPIDMHNVSRDDKDGNQGRPSSRYMRIRDLLQNTPLSNFKKKRHWINFIFGVYIPKKKKKIPNRCMMNRKGRRPTVGWKEMEGWAQWGDVKGDNPPSIYPTLIVKKRGKRLRPAALDGCEKKGGGTKKKKKKTVLFTLHGAAGPC